MKEDKDIEITILPNVFNNILNQYLSRYSPAESPNAPGVIIKSTDDIIRDLEDMAEFSVNEVAAYLLLQGYTSCFHDDGRHGWMMSRVPQR